MRFVVKSRSFLDILNIEGGDLERAEEVEVEKE
jgi:hypothetical protein